MRIALALAVLLSTPSARAQEPRLRVTDVVTATSDVHDVAVVGERVLLATAGGLVVLRGDAVDAVLTSRDGLPGTRLRSVSVLPEGAWVGGVEGLALVAFDGEAGAARVVRRLPLRRVTRAVRFSGATFFTTHGDGLHRLADDDGARPARVPVGGGARDRQTDALVVGDSLHVSTAGAGVLVVAADGSVRDRLTRDRGLPDDLVWDLHAAGDRILVATVGGIGAIADGRPAADPIGAIALPVRDVRSIAGDGDVLYAGTWGGGAYRIEGGRAARLGERTDAARVHALAVEGGRLLVAHDGGLHRAVDARTLAAVSTGGLPSADVTALARAFGSVFVGTFHHGLARLEGRRAVPVERAVERWGVDRRINDLAVTLDGDGRETLWIATDRGLYRHDGRSFTPVLDRHAPRREHVTSLHAEPGPDAPLWVTSSRTLACFAGGSWQSWTGDETFPVMQLHAVTVDARRRVWVGSLHGLYRFDPATRRFSRHTVSSGDLPVDWVTALLPWEDGVVAGTYHGGLAWFDGQRFRVEREERGGLPAGWVNPHAIERLGDSIFIGTQERGLVVGSSGRWVRLRTAQGLPSDDVTDVLPDGDGAAWVATRGGLARVVVR